MSSLPIKFAVLDDYHNIAAQHFAHIDPSQVETTVFNDTLPSYSHPKTSHTDRKALVNRLKPFSALSTMRERKPFPGELLRQLPNLKVIFATGGEFESWDLETTKDWGIAVCAAPRKGRTDGKGSSTSPRSLPIKQSSGHPTT
jgi:lactate dehydrogenase-like 2-hydroxyacid dehydrogenase